MARLYTSGLELGDAQSAGLTLFGAPTFATDRPRTGARSLKMTANDQFARRTFTGVSGRSYYARTYVNVSSRPPIGEVFGIFEWLAGVGWLNLGVDPDGTLYVNPSSGFTGQASAFGLVALNTWYCVEMRVMVNTAGNDQYEVRLDGTTVISTQTAEWSTSVLSLVDYGNHNTGVATGWLDDLALNDDQGASQNSWPGAGAVYTLFPAADPGTSSANWQKPGTATTLRHTSVDNVPPVYEADPTLVAQAERMLRNAVSLANAALLLATTSYDAAGIPAGDAIALVQAVALTGHSANSPATAGDVGVSANPVVAQAAFTTFSTTTATATATTWQRKEGTVSYLPSVTRGTGATLQVRKVTAATRVAMVNQLALIVESSPPAGAAWDPGVRADALGITDALSFALGETVADPVGVTDVPLTVAVFERAILTDQLGVTDVPLNVVEFNVQVLTDQLGLTDATGQVTGKEAALADLLGVTDVPLTVAVFERSVLGDQLGLTDAQALARASLVADATGITDLALPVAGKETALADLLALTDSRAFAVAPSVADALGLTDAPAFVAVTLRGLADPIGLTDAQAFAAVLERSVADPIGLTDAQAFAAATQRDLADLLGLTDLADPAVTSGAVGWTRTVDDLLGVTDVTALEGTFARALADSLGLTDAQALAAGAQRAVDDALGLTDAQAFAAGRAVADSLGLTDAQAFAAVTQRVVADALGLTDAPPALLAVQQRSVADALGLTDARAFAVDGRVADALGLTDARVPAVVMPRSLADSLGLADLVTAFTAEVQPAIYMLTPSGWVRLLTPEMAEAPSGWVRIFTGT